MDKEIKGLTSAAKRILMAVRDKERIIVFGDGDLDGIISVVIFKQALEILGESLSAVFFANRKKYGYGLSIKCLDFFKDKSPALLVVFDCGTNNMETIDIAQKAGFSVIVVDHHVALQKLPDDLIIINPKQEGDDYPFKEMCASGLSYYLAKKILNMAQKEFMPETLLELAMIGTFFDRMPISHDNEKIIEQGLIVLPLTERMGLRMLMDVAECEIYDQEEIIDKVIAPLSAAVGEHAENEAFMLLTSNNAQEIETLSNTLMERAKQKKQKVRDIIDSVEQNADMNDLIIFSGSKDYELFMLGSVASFLSRKYDKPVFIYSQYEKESQGSVRSTEDIDSVKLMSSCSHLVKNYGGHPKASGFGLKNENLDEFKKCLIENLINPIG